MSLRLSLEFRLWLFAFLLALPFVGRSYFVDDHYQLLMARGILDHPSRPYDFLADDDGISNAGWERGGFPRMVNPPLHHYLMAVLLKLSGDPSLGPAPDHPSGGGRIWVVRLGMAAFAALAVPLLGLLARRCLVPPGPAGFLAAVTPAFWLSSYSLLIDSTMLTFFLGALVAWIEGIKRDRALLLALAGALMGAAILTKYTGGFVVLLAGIYWYLERGPDGRRRPAALWALLLPAAVLAGWTGWNVLTYGASHFLESSRRVVQAFSWTHVLTFLTFFGGVFLFPLGSWIGIGRRGHAWVGAAAVWAALFTIFLASSAGGFSAGQAALVAFLSTGGALFFLRILSVKPDPRVPTDAFLLAWLVLGAAQMIFVMPWVAARYYLTILPPSLLLLLRIWRREQPHEPRALSRRAGFGAAGMLLFTAALGVADFRQAAVGRAIVRDAARDGWAAPGRRLFYGGDSFTGSLLGYAGWKALFPTTELETGDLVLHQEVVMPRWWFSLFRGRIELVKEYVYPAGVPLKLMDMEGSAGFYASAWGALPFTFSRGPWERYRLWRVTGPGRGKSPRVPSSATEDDGPTPNRTNPPPSDRLEDEPEEATDN